MVRVIRDMRGWKSSARRSRMTKSITAAAGLTSFSKGPPGSAAQAKPIQKASSRARTAKGAELQSAKIEAARVRAHASTTQAEQQGLPAAARPKLRPCVHLCAPAGRPEYEPTNRPTNKYAQTHPKDCVAT